VNARSSHNVTDDAFKLAREMAKEIGDALFGVQLYGKEEANILKDRYIALHKELITYEAFVKADSEGYYFVGGFNFNSFDKELQIRISEHAFKWNACPLCTACAFVILPGLLEGYINAMKKKTASEMQLILEIRYMNYIETVKKRQKEDSLKYRLKLAFEVDKFEEDVSL